MSRDRCGVLVAGAAAAAGAEERIADIRQGTNLSVALAPDGATLVVDLLGQLWTSGGRRRRSAADAGRRAGTQSALQPDGGRLVYQRRNGEHWDLVAIELATGASGR